MGNQRQQTLAIRKLQRACNLNFDEQLCYNITQFYSTKHKREINRYTLQKQTQDGETGKRDKIELFSTYSLIQMVFFMRDYWFMLNNLPLPTDNEMWNKARKETVLGEYIKQTET